MFTTSKFTPTLLIIATVFVFIGSVKFAFAHGGERRDSYPYAIDKPDQLDCVKYPDGHFTFEEPKQDDFTEARITVCQIRQNVFNEALEKRDKKVCNKVRDEYYDKFHDGETYLFGALGPGGTQQAFEDKIISEIERCESSMYIFASTLKPPEFIKEIGGAVSFFIFISSILYLFVALKFFGATFGRFVLVQLLILSFSTVVFFMFGIFTSFFVSLSGTGSLISYEIFFINQYLILPSLIRVFAGFVISFLMVFFLLPLAKCNLNLNTKIKISFFYGLLFTPFFFPISQVVALMHLFYLKKTVKNDVANPDLNTKL